MKKVVGIIERKARRDYPLEYLLPTESEAALESHRGYNTVVDSAIRRRLNRGNINIKRARKLFSNMLTPKYLEMSRGERS